MSWATLSVQLLVLALGTAQVCADREHTHGGVAAPDCRMHHQPGGRRHVSEHAHHGHTSNKEPGGAQISCRCANDLLPTYLGQVAVLELPAQSPSFEVGVLDAPGADFTVDHSFSPPSPPPRR